MGANGFCRIAVPWFFVASGFFLAGHYGERNWYKNAIQKRIWTLLIPFVIWALIGLSVSFCIWYGAKLCGYQCSVVNPFENGFIPGVVQALGFDLHSINIGPIWYLRMLFLLVLISPMICWLIKRYSLSVSIVVLVVYGVYDTIYHFSEFWEYLISLRGVAYFSAGVAIRFGAWKSLLGNMSFIIASIGAGVVLLVMNSVFRVNGFVVGENLTDFCMVLPLMVSVWHFVSYLRLPRVCLENSFALYMMHVPLLLFSIAFCVLFGIRDEMEHSLLVALGRFVFAVLLSLFLALLVKRFAPRIGKLLLGGR